jgi:predicted CoA-binding protein
VLNYPDKIEVEIEGQLVYQKIVLFEGKGVYLVRVFVNSDKIPNLAKTVYRTSKFSKYE